MTVVVDASVAVKWLLAEPESPLARALAASGEDVVAPDMVLAECANVAWKRARRGEIDADQARAAVAAWPRWFRELLPAADLVDEAFALACGLDHPVYDCLYLAAAIRHDISLVTADRRLIARLADSPWQARILDLARLPASLGGRPG